MPKYTIRRLETLGAQSNGLRVGLIWLVPLATLFLGCFHWTPLLLAMLLTPLEVPKAPAPAYGEAVSRR